MHVGRAGTHGRVQDEVDDLDDRRVLVDDRARRLFGLLRRLARNQPRFEHAQRIAEVGHRRVHLVDDGLDLGARREHQPDRRGELRDELVLEGLGERVGDRDVDADAFARDRHGPQSSRVLLGEQRDDVAVELHLAELDDVHLQLLGEHPDECALAEQAQLDEDVAEALPGTRLGRQRLPELVFGDEAAADEELAQGKPDVTRPGLDLLVGLGGLFVGGASVRGGPRSGDRSRRGRVVT